MIRSCQIQLLGFVLEAVGVSLPVRTQGAYRYFNSTTISKEFAYIEVNILGT